MSNKPANDLPYKGKTICVVNTGSQKKKFVLQRLKKIGFTTVVINSEKNWADPYVDHWIIANTANHTESITAFRNFVKSHPSVHIDGVMTVWEDDVLLTSKIVEQFGFIGIPYSIAKGIRNKFAFREFCNNVGLPTPKHYLIKTDRDIAHVLKNFKFPLVVKPAFGASSAYVTKVDQPKDLADTVDYIRELISSDTESALNEGFELFVEEYIDGDEVDVDILLQNGKIKFYSIADNYDKTFGRFFLDRGQAIPSSLPSESQKALIDMAEETLEKLGITDACIHYEAKSTKNGPVPLEVNMRLGGDYIYSYIKSAWGIDFVEEGARIAIGDYLTKIEKPEEPRRYVVGWDLQPQESGILVELDIDPLLHEQKYLEEIYLSKEIGDQVLRPPEGYGSLGWITVRGDNMLDAQDNLREALKYIHYKVAAYDEESALGKTSRKNSLSAAVYNKKLLARNAKVEKVRTVSLANQRELRIGIAANLPNTQSGRAHVTAAQEINHLLQAKGYRTTIFDFNNLSQTVLALQLAEIDLMFNAAIGIENNELLKPQVAAIFEAMNIPYTGTSALNLALSRDKIRAKKLFRFHDIPTPAFDYAYTINDSINPELRYPLLVKPADADHSFGISQTSVVKNKKELDAQLSYVIEKLGHPALVEEYIEGDEYSVSILGSDYNDLRVFPLSRAKFPIGPKNKWKILTESVKNKEDSLYSSAAKNLNPKLEALISEIAIDTYKIMKCRDYGRVELRIDREGNPYVLELNTNPTLGKTSPVVRAAKHTNLEHIDLLEEIIKLAINRYKNNQLQTPYFL